MQETIGLLLTILLMLLGRPAPTTVSITPNDGNGTMNIASSSFAGELSSYQLERGHDVALFELLCADPMSPLSGYSLSSTGGSFSSIDVGSCTDLTKNGAEFEMVEFGVNLEFSCNDCKLVMSMARDQNQIDFDHYYGIMRVTVTGSFPEITISSK